MPPKRFSRTLPPELRRMLTAHDRWENEVQRAFKCLNRIEREMSRSLGRPSGSFLSSLTRERALRFDEAQAVLECLRRESWWALSRRLERRGMLDSAKWERLSKRMADGFQPPKITRSSVARLVRDRIPEQVMRHENGRSLGVS